ncbi:hypothetical protein ACINWCA157_B0030 (plasmid) [Acinetobacter radioresistens WC-A-157]|nr:hypothetical protein ACINWCA157_B0030 [Acinetobacter radioresistens WC-A-157]
MNKSPEGGFFLSIFLVMTKFCLNVHRWTDIMILSGRIGRPEIKQVLIMRASIVAIFTNYPTGKLVHFCGHEVLTGSNNNIWFPIFDEKTLFQEIEKIMINCRVAHNVTHIERIRRGDNENGYFEDYRITYNLAI